MRTNFNFQDIMLVPLFRYELNLELFKPKSSPWHFAFCSSFSILNINKNSKWSRGWGALLFCLCKHCAEIVMAYLESTVDIWICGTPGAAGWNMPSGVVSSSCSELNNSYVRTAATEPTGDGVNTVTKNSLDQLLRTMQCLLADK